ncbi:alpha/beta fold hydrolase, partial [Pseudonocardia pini]|uniref:alpha/beta fold hydrolase n=1 Tax=Pseudonocardia pini TaxID=2758030 RepID=UPI0015F11207
MLSEERVAVNGIELNVASAGEGPPVVLLHGFPHTWRIWSEVIGPLAAQHRVLAPDLRGFGASTMSDQLDADTLARDLEALLERVGRATVVALDAGVPGAFLAALRRPDLVSRLVLIEGTLPGGDFPAPWWFGFHAVPGLTERVVRPAEYVGWFY